MSSIECLSAIFALPYIKLTRHALDRHGMATRGTSKIKLTIAALFGRSGLHSTRDSLLFLANVAKKTLRTAYEFALNNREALDFAIRTGGKLSTLID